MATVRIFDDKFGKFNARTRRVHKVRTDRVCRQRRWRAHFLWRSVIFCISSNRYSDSLRVGRSGDLILVETRFTSLVQNGPGAHPAPYTMGTGPFPGVKRPGRGVDHPPSSSVEVKGRVELYMFPVWTFVACSKVNFTFLHDVLRSTASRFFF